MDSTVLQTGSQFLGMEYYWWAIIVATAGVVGVAVRWGIKSVWDWYHKKKHDREHQLIDERISRLENLLKKVPLRVEGDEPLRIPDELRQLEQEVGEMARTEGLLDCGELIKLGNVMSIQGELVGAKSYYHVALLQSKASNDSLMMGRATGSLGRVCQQTGDYDKANEYHQSALEIFRDVGYRRGEAVALAAIGTLQIIRLQWDEALEYLRAAVAINRELDNDQGVATQLSRIGVVFKNKGELDQALKYYFQALEINSKIGYRQGEGTALGNIGEIYQDKGKLVLAMNHYKNALVIHREVGNRESEAIQLANIGLVFKDRGDSVAALEYLKDALNILTLHGLARGRNDIEKAIAEIEAQLKAGDATP